MRPRSEFKALLDTFCDNVYGIAPSSDQMVYPCILYKEDQESVKRADNLPYDVTDRYMVTVIEDDPQRPVAKAIRETLPMCTFNRRYEAEDMIHTVFTIFF